MKLLLTLLFVLCLPAAAQNNRFDIAGGGSYQIYPETFRAYKNKYDVLQVDMLVEFVSKDGKASRSIEAVTGCVEGFGKTASVDDSGNAVGEIYNWTRTGTRVYDSLAMRLCLEAFNRANKKTGVSA